MIINLQDDYKNIMIKKIMESGLDVPDNFDTMKLIITYYSFLRKKDFAGPNNIKKSKNFKCPSELQKGLNKLEDIIGNGGDILPYFNRSAFDLSEYDYLFLDWGIMHFHLGDKLRPHENLIERTGPILFAYKHFDTVYFINIYKHGHWADKEVIQEMYNNWPELIEQFTFKDVLSVSHDPTDRELMRLRKCGVNTSVQIKDSHGKLLVLMAPGMGLTAARTSINDTRLYQQTMKTLRRIQLRLISEEEHIKEDMQSKGIEIKQEISFKLTSFDQHHLYLLDEDHDYTITVRHA
ncbi:hypothetical protein [Lysinibacillus sp. RC79]|uniref:hypothetical protein n=1 Tax=Lysinibacillus sp. RC79 TaxID=3156296 RepID=UPI003513EB19